MRFLARIKKGSATDKLWRGNRRAGGLIGAVNFRLIDGVYCSTRELVDAEVNVLRANRSVELETLQIMPAAVAAPAEPISSEPDGAEPPDPTPAAAAPTPGPVVNNPPRKQAARK